MVYRVLPVARGLQYLRFKVGKCLLPSSRCAGICHVVVESSRHNFVGSSTAPRRTVLVDLWRHLTICDAYRRWQTTSSNWLPVNNGRGYSFIVSMVLTTNVFRFQICFDTHWEQHHYTPQVESLYPICVFCSRRHPSPSRLDLVC